MIADQVRLEFQERQKLERAALEMHQLLAAIIAQAGGRIVLDEEVRQAVQPGVIVRKWFDAASDQLHLQIEEGI